MLQITETEIKTRLALDNPWWEREDTGAPWRDWPRRAYYDAFLELVTQKQPHRAVVLMGPRRVGKTVMMTQVIGQLIEDGIAPERVLYVSVDTPTYTGLSLERLLNLFLSIAGHQRGAELFVFFDEIQYHPDWERHLKSLVDAYPAIRFVASGSAAAALKMKSLESGAGRFTDFLLPPLSFYEFLLFQEEPEWLADLNSEGGEARNIERLNAAFVDYINFGGFPEAALQEDVRRQMSRFIASDIVDKVLLRDLPSLYGISDTQELKRLFTTLAYNSGQEVTFDALAKASGVAKNTLRKYLEFLEAAFLIHKLHRVDQNGRRFKRVTHFKVYLTNVSIRSALFGPVALDDEKIGTIVETAFVSQLSQTVMANDLFYARWEKGEVDLVQFLPNGQRPAIVGEIKWSDRCFRRTEELAALIQFCRRNDVKGGQVMTRTAAGQKSVDGVTLFFKPSAVAAYHASQMVDAAFALGVHPTTGREIAKRQ